MPILLAVCSCLRRPRYPFFVCTGTEYFLHVLCLGDQGYLPFAVKTLTPHCIVKLSASPMSVKVIWAQFHAFKFHMYSTEYIDQIRYPLTTFQLLIIHSDWTRLYPITYKQRLSMVPGAQALNVIAIFLAFNVPLIPINAFQRASH